MDQGRRLSLELMFLEQSMGVKILVNFTREDISQMKRAIDKEVVTIFLGTSAGSTFIESHIKVE